MFKYGSFLNQIMINKYLKVLKIAIGSALAIMLADLLQLDYGTSAGIIVLLTIQDTKKETLLIGAKRAASFVIAMLLAIAVFSLTGYSAVSFGIFLLLFIVILSSLNLQDGISINAVLVTHFLPAATITYPLFINELLLFVIGAGTGMLLNLYIPRNVRLIRMDQERIEDNLRFILKSMSADLQCEEQAGCPGSSPQYLSNYTAALDTLESDIHNALNRAYENMNNTFLSDTRYYIQYMEMRRNQCGVLKTIYEHMKKINQIPPQALKISTFLYHVSTSLHEYNNAEEMLDEFERLRESYSQEPLPADRIEFENRAILYQILNELECFILLKREFVSELTGKQIETYWEDYKDGFS